MFLVFGTLLGTALLSPDAGAQTVARAMKWQFSLPITFTGNESFDGQQGTSVEVSDDLGWGFGFGYHLSDNFLVGMDFTWLSANYDANIATDLNDNGIPDSITTVSGVLDSASLQFTGQYNILKKPFTPFLRASLGTTWVDTNIPSGPATGTCWWHPYYGYICDTWQPTFEDNMFSYGAAAGVRADLQRGFFLEASYQMLWLDFDEDTAEFDGWRMTLGWIF
jgi:hypothetical protein